MYLPKTKAVFPFINTHRIAKIIPRTEIKKNPLLLLAFLAVATPLPAEILVFVAFILTLLKLDIRSKARFTKAFSEADAGVVGIDSTKAQRAEVNQFCSESPSWPL